MTEIDLHTPRFAQPEVLRVSGLSAATLQTWVNRGHVQLSEQNPGSGRRRLYSPLDVVNLAIMGRLYGFGINITHSQDLAEDVARQLVQKGEIEWNLYSIYNPPIPGVTILTSPRSLKFAYHLGDPDNMRVSSLVEPGSWLRRGLEGERDMASLFDGVRQREAVEEALKEAGVEFRKRDTGLGNLLKGGTTDLQAAREALSQAGANATDAHHTAVREALAEATTPYFVEIAGVKLEIVESGDDRAIDPKRRAYHAARGVHAEPVLIIPVGEIANGVIAQLKAIEDSEISPDDDGKPQEEG